MAHRDDHAADHEAAPSAVTVGKPLAPRPAPDELARRVARARIVDALFDVQERVEVGRYHLLEHVGTGGMGVVWGAWDPQLERRVAIKLVKAELAAARERFVLEGQALARLSHPNVVPVYDVGVVDDRIYLVMEWVRGSDLRAHARVPRTVNEVLAVYRAAGEGLAAAHAAGLIHRDFKPDNVMVGDDGRVRVLDFGLAQHELHAIGGGTRGSGTPRYMAPEQRDGAVLTPAVDQYAFGISLREALVRRTTTADAEVPAWLAATIARATAVSPAERFPTMRALLDALARDPARIWRRRIAVAGALGLAGAAFAVGTLREGAAAPEPCAGAAATLASTWNLRVRSELVAHLRTLGPYGAAEAERLPPRLAEYASAWIGAHRTACLAHERKELTAQLYEQRLGCLARGQVALATVVEVLTRTPRDRLPRAIVAAQALPEAAACALATPSPSIDPPAVAVAHDVTIVSAQVERAHFLALAIDPTAVTVAQAAAISADRTAYAPLIARAQLALGFATLGEGQGAGAAIPCYERATAAALEAGDSVTAVEAYAREVFAIGITPPELRPPDTIDVVATRRFALQLATGTRHEGAFGRALLLNNLGTERLAAGDRAAARAWFQRAIAEPHVGVQPVELLSAAGNLALVTEAAEERARLFAEQRAQLELALGPNHAFTLDSRMQAALLLANRGAVASELRDLCHRLATWHGDESQRVNNCALELAWLAAERGDETEERDALRLIGADPDSERLARGYAQLLSGELAETAREMHAAAEPHERGSTWWDRFAAVDLLLVAASAEVGTGHVTAAIATLRECLGVLADPAIDHGAAYTQRRLARANSLLARLLPAPDALAPARAALAWYRAAGGYEAALPDLEAIVGSR